MQTYQDKINEVLKYIDIHLEDKLDLDKLANIIFLSKFHFHRIMKSYLGESLGAYINRIRVETGAKLLKYSDNSITEIAYKIGYESPTSFNKSFKKQFQVSPSHFRKYPDHNIKVIKKRTRKTNFALIAEKKKIQAFTVVYRTSRGITGSEETSNAWRKLIGFAMQNDLFNEGTKRYGVHWDDPSITSEQNIRYDACIGIDKDKIIAKYPMKHIAGGNYLCFVYKGDYQYLGDVYDQVFRDYILKDKVKLREEPIFEQYINDTDETPIENLLTEIFIPII